MTASNMILETTASLMHTLLEGMFLEDMTAVSVVEKIKGLNSSLVRLIQIKSALDVAIQAFNNDYVVTQVNQLQGRILVDLSESSDEALPEALQEANVILDELGELPPPEELQLPPPEELQLPPPEELQLPPPQEREAGPVASSKPNRKRAYPYL